ncbi:MAG: hypothetical protein PHG54_12610 [Smithellaceae bacterium]|nr:hypothetical protein [Smithellaceae bacterium]
MKRKMFFYAFLALLLLAPAQLPAADFAWMPDFNVQAQADPSGFRVRLATRFHIGDAQVSAVLGNFPKPADAYVALRLGEMSGKPVEYVAEQYKANKGQGWGALAKSLGIKPGSREFHALKRGDDLYASKGKGKGKKNK